LITLICPEVIVGGMVKEVHAAHILVKNKDSCDKILVEFKAGKGWDELAKKNSTCPSAKKGGDLGAAFNAQKGDVVGPIKTQFGWHLIKVIDQK
jgi:peptidyl-prolyl cis-trans isomerase C